MSWFKGLVPGLGGLASLRVMLGQLHQHVSWAARHGVMPSQPHFLRPVALHVRREVHAADFVVVRGALNLHARQGYGLTETCAASFLALARPSNTGTVGPPTSRAALLAPLMPAAATLPPGSPHLQVCIQKCLQELLTRGCADCLFAALQGAAKLAEFAPSCDVAMRCEA